MSLKNWFKETFNVAFTLTNIRAELDKAASTYYNTGNKIITDKDFDELKDFYELKTKSKFPVGAPVVGSTLELSHSYTEFAGTLSKCNSIDDVKQWLKAKKIDKDSLLVSVKADGHSIIIEFENHNGKLEVQKVLTRGADGKGKDLTSIFKSNLKQIPIPNVDYDCAVAYEAIVKYEDFETLLKEEKLHREYKNPRSVINGIFSTKGQKLFKYITLLPIKIKPKNDVNHIKRLEELLLLEEMLNATELNFQVVSLKDIEEIYKMHESDRADDLKLKEVGYMYDGLVIETHDEKTRKRLGHGSSEPHFATALKFTPAAQRTTVKEVLWSIEGHSSRHTPVVHFEPVIIRGNTYKQVSLANYKRFLELDLHEGDEIVFTLRNDTLGYVEKLPTSTNSNKKPVAIKAPTECVNCMSPLYTDDVFLSCNNPSCDINIVGDIFAFVEKSGIKNVGLEMIKKMFGVVLNNVEDLLFLDAKEISKIEGLGKVSANNIVKEVNKVVPSMYDYMLLGSMNIPHIGRTRAKLILSHLDFFELLEMVGSADKKAVTKSLININGIGEEIITLLYNGIIDKHRTLLTFVNNINITVTKTTHDKDFKQLTFCHTGSPSPLKNRAELKELIESKGHKLSGGVSKNTTYLINNDTSSTTGKNLKAQELNVTIITVDTLISLLS